MAPIPGIVANQLQEVPAGDYIPTDPDATFYADFLGGVYERNQQQVVLADLFSGVVTSDIDATGHKIWFTTTSRPVATANVLADIEAAITNGGTFLLETYASSSDNNGPAFVIMDTDDENTASFILEMDGLPNQTDYDSLSIGGTHSLNLPGVNRVAYGFTRDIGGGDYRHAISSNGDTIAASQNLAYRQIDKFPSAGVDTVKFGHMDNWSFWFGHLNGGTYVRKIALYGPKTDAELAVLSALT